MEDKDEKHKHMKEIHEILEGSPICKLIHRMGLCGCRGDKEE